MTEAQQFAYRVRNTACDGTGSSFATADGIITNRHVASGSTALQLSSWSGNDFDATPQAISEDPGADLALLSGTTASRPAILDPNNVPDGTPVWAAGYPEGNQLTLTPGIVVDYIDGSVYGSPGQIMELTNAIEPGNSGSPLLDGAGQVVGVVFAINTVTGNGLAIPVSTLNQFLAAPGTSTYGPCIG
jgi:S1-C subfamily serine protease